ncbi:alpha/beta fold hydrolase [Pseudonocardia endophytica]|uniref:Alpha-beta hydrolase superfamily lysophospholipase n=1 Tax=Pseudonocardia endophytica TaxID=401976 RepID=A0A4R1HQP2_PSEEN|nr:alpha/beta hydrolase [Pseudonocardia endophytica]TCK24924.1 alpha-beta hydrolase superfamily lysophospholipase [Pseudonocardia endophytica]
MDTYRTEAGRRELQDWCRDELARCRPGVVCGIVDSPLGPTHLTSAGAGPARVVVVPGAPLNAATSRPLIASLAGSCRVTVADVPGQPGLSCATRPPDDLIGRFRSWVDHVLDSVVAEGDGPVVLLGESGGAAAALCATPGPGIAGLVLSSPAGLIGARTTPAMVWASVPWHLRPSSARSARVLASMDGEPSMDDHERVIEWMTLVARHARSSSLLPPPLPNAVLREWRTTPTIVLLGERDPLFPHRRMAPPVRTLLGGTPVVVPGGGHLLSHTHPSDLADAVAELVG